MFVTCSNILNVSQKNQKIIMEKGIQPIDLTQTSDSDDEPAPPKKKQNPFGGNKRSKDDSDDSDDVPKKKNDPFARATGKSRNPFD